jgi:outer membrane protein TolC
MTVRLLLAATLLVAAALPAAAQSAREASEAFRCSVPQGTATAEPLALSFKDTLDRALQFNLGLLLQEESRKAAHGARWEALADLLPNFRGSVSERRQVINLEAFGFPAPDPIVGPFNVFDARIGVSQRIVDLAALNTARAASLDEKVQAVGIRSARELVVLVTVNLYLEASALRVASMSLGRS